MSSDPLGETEFVEAFARNGRALWLLAAAWVGRGDANDLVQETARIAWQRRGRFTRGTDVVAWLAQIVRHTGANWRRKPRPVAGDGVAEPVARTDVRDGSPLDVERCELPDELARPLAALGEISRACLLLHVVGELPFAAIAMMLDIPENTAMSHARRARLELRAALAPDAPAARTP